MKRLLLAALLLGTVSAARAQLSAPPVTIDSGNVAQEFSGTSAAKANLLSDLVSNDAFSSAAAKSANAFASPVIVTALALPLDAAEPASPSPRPKFVYGSRDDYRWELGLGVAWLRFRSSVFDASAVGVNSSLVYYTNEWFGVEGNFIAVFAPTIFQNEHVKIATYGAGPKVAWRRKQWEPWLHGIFGGAHEQPQVVGQSRNSYVIKAGGGADYRWNPRISFRLEGDYVRTGFFKQSQNDFQLSGGIVFHF
jgi:opacity protein-like surface antigen